MIFLSDLIYSVSKTFLSRQAGEKSVDPRGGSVRRLLHLQELHDKAGDGEIRDLVLFFSLISIVLSSTVFLSLPCSSPFFARERRDLAPVVRVS